MAKGLLLPSLPDIVPVRLKEPSVVDLVCVLVAPAATVTPSKGSAPDNTHDIAKLFVKAIVLPPPDTVLFGIFILVIAGSRLVEAPSVFKSVLASILISVLLRFTIDTPTVNVPEPVLAVPKSKILLLEVVLVGDVNVVGPSPKALFDKVIENPDTPIFSKLVPQIVANCEAAVDAPPLKEPVLLPGLLGADINSEFGT